MASHGLSRTFTIFTKFPFCLAMIVLYVYSTCTILVCTGTYMYMIIQYNTYSLPTLYSYVPLSAYVVESGEMFLSCVGECRWWTELTSFAPTALACKFCCCRKCRRTEPDRLLCAECRKLAWAVKGLLRGCCCGSVVVVQGKGKRKSSTWSFAICSSARLWDGEQNPLLLPLLLAERSTTFCKRRGSLGENSNERG